LTDIKKSDVELIQNDINEIKSMLHKQSIQNKRLMMISILNVYFVLAAVFFVTMF
jgi:hypothetical protein